MRAHFVVGTSYLAGGVTGKSELHVSTMHFHLPSACFFQISTILPRSSTGFPDGSFIVS